MDPAKEMKKIVKRARLTDNKRKGKLAEWEVASSYRLNGHEVKKTGCGSDFKTRKIDPSTGRLMGPTVYHEVKSGKAKLSKLQKKTKMSKEHYKVDRV